MLTSTVHDIASIKVEAKTNLDLQFLSLRTRREIHLKMDNSGQDEGIDPAIAAIGQAINDLPMPAVANPHSKPLPITSQARAHARSLSQLCALDGQLAAQVSPTVATGTMTRSALQLPLSTTSFPADFPPEMLRTPSPASGNSTPPAPQNHQVQFHIG